MTNTSQGGRNAKAGVVPEVPPAARVQAQRPPASRMIHAAPQHGWTRLHQWLVSLEHVVQFSRRFAHNIEEILEEAGLWKYKYLAIPCCRRRQHGSQ
jgi:hypothetical protein